MIQDAPNKILLKIKGYIKHNWGSLFVAGFLLLLIVAAVSLDIGFSPLASNVADYAYYVLVVGVSLQFACFLKYRGKSDDEAVV